MEDRHKKLSFDDQLERMSVLREMLAAQPAFAPNSGEEWRLMVRKLRLALQMYREYFREPGLTDQQTLAAWCVSIVANYFIDIPEAGAEFFHQPFALIGKAFDDLADGKVPDLFRPVNKPNRLLKNPLTDLESL